jgi:hypothetical protein
MYSLKLSKLSELNRTLTSSLALCITGFGSIGHGCRLRKNLLNFMGIILNEFVISLTQ